MGSILASVCVLLTGASAQKAPSIAATPEPTCQPLVEQVLNCPSLQFTYRLPFGWVDRTEEMQQMTKSDPTQDAQGADSAATRKPAPPTRTKTLLAAFERPPGTEGDSLNPAVVIAAEARSVYPQIKTASDYFGPLSEIAEQRGLKMDGDPYLFSAGSKRVARADFNGGTEKKPVQQSSLVVLEKGYILSFTFLAASSDEINNLVAGLTFTAGSRKPASK
jgi:hypothetical protein